MDAKEIKLKTEQFNDLVDKIATLFDESNIEVGLVMGILSYLYIKTAKEQTSMSEADCMYVMVKTIKEGFPVIGEDDDEEDDEPTMQFGMEKPTWLN